MHAGDMITPNLRLARPLGRGATGHVWVAEHLGLGAQVAVKIISAAAAADPELVARFQREAPVLAQIKSPHVAQVLDHGATTDGSLYIALELLEGETLGHRLKRLGPLPPAEVALLVGQAARALARAHQVGVVHRDIKPDNLFVMDLDGEIFLKVLDFGIAQRASLPGSRMTVTGSMLGTPLYMSPEQFISAKHVDHRADLWALAVVGYQALTGKLPFQAESMAQLALQLSRAEVTPPTELRPELPPAVDAWAARALHRDPEARFGSAREMAAALARALGADEAAGPVSGVPSSRSSAPASQPASTSGQSLPAPATTDPGRALRRAQGTLAAGVALGLLVGGAAAFLVLRGGRAPESTASAVGSEAPTALPAPSSAPAPTALHPIMAPRASAAASVNAAAEPPSAPPARPAPARGREVQPAPSASVSAQPEAPPRSATERLGI